MFTVREAYWVYSLMPFERWIKAIKLYRSTKKAVKNSIPSIKSTFWTVLGLLIKAVLFIVFTVIVYVTWNLMGGDFKEQIYEMMRNTTAFQLVTDTRAYIKSRGLNYGMRMYSILNVTFWTNTAVFADDELQEVYMS